MYETFFGLSGKPFQLNPDPAFFFGSRGHKRAFAYLQYGVHQSEGFIIITGEVGAGKTTLVRSLLEQIDPNQLVAAQLVTTQLDAEDLLRSVAIAFGLPTKALDKAHLLAELEAFLLSLVPQGKRALLIVDEAQNLTGRSIEELRMLSNFQLGSQGLLKNPNPGSWHPHNLRHSFSTECSHVGVKPEVREFFMGHISGISWVYQHPELHEADILAEWRKVHPYVSLDYTEVALRDEFSERERSMVSEIVDLKRLYEELKRELRASQSGRPSPQAGA